MIRLIYVFIFMIVAIPCYGNCTRHNPCLTINIIPAPLSIPDDTLSGTAVASIVVTLTPSGAFTGSLSFGSPYGNDGGLFALSGSDIVLAGQLPAGNSIQQITVVATQ
jgi:hypothetical protein